MSGEGSLEAVEYRGSIVYARRVKDGLLECPICYGLFQTAPDLMRHIVAHAKGYTEKRVKKA
ncbi:MAG: hypothetical protein P3X22_007595 [Thermoprotei archaeon]|nr:hypothetical protein [Thermoprotei archaeon]